MNMFFERNQRPSSVRNSSSISLDHKRKRYLAQLLVPIACATWACDALGDTSTPILFTIQQSNSPQRSVASSSSETGSGTAPSSRPKTEHYENLELFQKIMSFVESQYVREVNPRDLLFGAIKGMMDTLDPHSSFLSEEVFRDMRVDTSGKFGGLGLELGLKDNILTVIAPYEDTPAWKAGLKPGDRITRINGESTKGMTIAEAVTRMRGRPGTKATVTVYRESNKSVKDYTLVRDTIRIQAVKSEMLEPGFGYVRLTTFNENAAADLRKAIAQLEKKEKLKGLIFDLRSNPGGLLDQAVDVSSLFINEGVIVSTMGRDPSQKEVRYAKKGVAREDLQLAVLINSSTASAAEIVAGALQDHHRALILGQTSFGKGSVQSVVDLGKDLGLKLTIAQYYTPSGRSIQERGVVPDVVLDDYDPKRLADARRRTDAPRERDLRGHIPNPHSKPKSMDAKEVDPEDLIGESELRKDFTQEELDLLSQQSDSSRSPRASKAESEQPARLIPKEDFQVLEALSHLKAVEFFRRSWEAKTVSKATDEQGK